MSPPIRRLLWFLFLGGIWTLVFAPLPLPHATPQARTLRLEARQFAYTPGEVHLNVGDTVTLQLLSTDVVHGLYLDGYGLSLVADPGQTATLTFVADRPGSFRFRCNVTCGAMHPFMIGKLTVGTDLWLSRALAFSFFALFGVFVFFGASSLIHRQRSTAYRRRIDLTRFPLLKSALRSRYPQLAIWLVMLAGYLFAIVAGWLGTPVGSHNFAIVFVWIAWWAVLILVVVPFFGRGWCSVCPIPLLGEWMQRGAILNPLSQPLAWLNLRWPKALRNIWLQNFSFILLALFSSRLLTTPQTTALVLAAMLLTAVALSLLFERRAFCRYLCPVSGFIGLYAQVAPVELRVKDKQRCAQCVGKPCYHGNENGYGCPWGVFPGGLTKNTSCGLCLECLRTCPYDNIAVNLRPFAADLARPSARLDEAFKAFIMLGAALLYAAVLLGPWGDFKDAAYRIGSAAWFLYLAAFLALIFLLLPGMFWLALRPRPLERAAARKAFAALSSVLIPLGLMFWVAFSLSFVLTNASYVFATLSDPLGLGWNLFGTADLPWQPWLTSLLAPAQALALVGGFLWSARLAQVIAPQHQLSPRPLVLYSAALTLLMLWLLR